MVNNVIIRLVAISRCTNVSVRKRFTFLHLKKLPNAFVSWFGNQNINYKKQNIDINQTASDCEVKLNALSFRAGSSDELPPPPSEPPTRSDTPIISTFPGASIWVMD